MGFQHPDRPWKALILPSREDILPHPWGVSSFPRGRNDKRIHVGAVRSKHLPLLGIGTHLPTRETVTRSKDYNP